MIRTARRGALLLLILAAALSGAASPGREDAGSAALIGEVLSPRSRMEEDLRVLTDEIGGRVTGSPAYEESLRWGVEALRRAGVDSVLLEAYGAPAKWEGRSASAAVVAP